MKTETILKRVKKNMLDVLAGNSYCGPDSELVREFNKSGEKAFIGIQHEDGTYTLVGVNYVYYSDSGGNESKITNSDFLKVLQEHGMKSGKSSDFEYLSINESESIWVQNGPTMCALWNVILLIERESAG